MKLDEVLTECTNTVDAWRQTEFDNIDQTSSLMKDMALVLYELARHKDKYKKLWNAKCYFLINEEGRTGTAAEKVANEEVPELDTLRLIMKVGKDCLDVMRSQISYLKTDQLNTNK